jgi:hypothetical protein
MQLAVGRLDRIAGNPQRLRQGARRGQGSAHIEHTIEDQLANGPLHARMQGQGAMRRVADPGFDGFKLGVLEQLVCISS